MSYQKKSNMQDRWFYPLMYVVCGLLFTAALLLCSTAGAQTMPTFFNPDPQYWYEQYQSEQARANGLEQAGKTAITGLQSDLKKANATIVKQNDRLNELATQNQELSRRAEAAESKLKPVTEELGKYKGTTWAGRTIRKARDVLAVVGGISVLIIAL